MTGSSTEGAGPRSIGGGTEGVASPPSPPEGGVGGTPGGSKTGGSVKKFGTDDPPPSLGTTRWPEVAP
jgi:hypothetical protein